MSISILFVYKGVLFEGAFSLRISLIAKKKLFVVYFLLTNISLVKFSFQRKTLCKYIVSCVVWSLKKSEPALDLLAFEFYVKVCYVISKRFYVISKMVTRGENLTEAEPFVSRATIKKY